MTKEEILKLYIADLNNLVADGMAKRSRIMDLENELESLNHSQKCNHIYKYLKKTKILFCRKCNGKLSMKLYLPNKPIRS